MWMIILAVVVVLLTAWYFHVSYKMGFWKRLGVPEAPGTFPFGSNTSWDFYTMKKAYNEETITLAREYPNEKFVGVYHMFGIPKLTILDLELAKQVTIKDFGYFVDRQPDGYEFAAPNSEKNKYWVNTLLLLTGDKWKRMRNCITPVFTSGKLKGMTDLIQRSCDGLLAHLSEHCGEEIDCKGMMRDYSVDVIASTGFGIECNSFRDTKNPIKINGDKLISNDMGWKQYLQFVIMLVFPFAQKILDFPLTDPMAMEFFADLIRSSIKERKVDKVRRNDFIDLVTDVLTKEKQKNTNIEQDEESIVDNEESRFWSEEELETAIVSNAIMLFIVGFDTSSSTSAIMFYYLAKNPEVQERLYEEISHAVKESSNGKLENDDVMQLPYLDMVLNETLRSYNIGSHLERATTRDYKIPGTEIVIPKGIHVNIASPAFMADEKYFPNPEQFNPENFSADAKAARNQYAFSAFGLGPRNCIGMRFALMKIKTAMSRVIFEYKVVACSKTVDELIPDPTSTSLMPKGNVFVTFEKR